MKLIPKLAKKVYPLGRLNEKFGDPRRVAVVLLSQGNVVTVIDPVPEVVRVTPQQLEQFKVASIEVKPTDYQVKEIPRFKYSDTLLTRCRYLVDARIEEGVYVGTPCEFRYLDDSDPIYYSVVISGHLMR